MTLIYNQTNVYKYKFEKYHILFILRNVKLYWCLTFINKVTLCDFENQYSKFCHILSYYYFHWSFQLLAHKDHIEFIK